MIDRQAPSTPSAGMSMRRIWLSSARDQGVVEKREALAVNKHLDECRARGVIAGPTHGGDQDLEQLVELGGRCDGDGDGSVDLDAHFVGEVVVGDADGVGMSGLTDGWG